MFTLFKLFNLFKPTSYYIGADVDDTHIKLVELSYRSGHYHIENYAIFLRHSDWAIQWAATGFVSKNIIASVSNAQVITHNITLSTKLSEQEQATFLALEMEKLALLPANDLALAFQKLSSSSTHLNVFCAAIRQETLTKVFALFQTIDGHVSAIDLNEKAEKRVQEYGGIDALAITENQHSSEWIEQWEKDAPTLTTAIGLAMHSHDHHALNFLSWQKMEQKKRNNIQRIISYVIAGSCLIVSLFLWLKPESSIQNTAVIIPPIMKKISIKKALPESGFQQVSLSRLKYVGFLENSQHRTGLLQTPDGHIYYVFIGDELGKERAVITQLSDKAIIVTLNHRRISIE